MPTTEVKTVSFSVPGGKRAAGMARRSVLSVQADLPHSIRHRLALLLSELVNNAIQHGGAGPHETVQVKVASSTEKVRVEVFDPGSNGAPAARPARGGRRLWPSARRPARRRLGPRRNLRRRQHCLVRTDARRGRPPLSTTTHPPPTTERALRLLRWIVIVSIVDFILLIPLVVGVIVDYHGLAPVIGPIHGFGFLLELYLVARGAALRWWGWWYPAVTLVTAGRPAPSSGTTERAARPSSGPPEHGYTHRPSAAVAQLARASACHAEGRGFESHQPL